MNEMKSYSGRNLGPISTFILLKHRIAKMKQTQKQTQNGYLLSYFEEEKIAILFFLKKHILEISRFEVQISMFLGAFFIPSRSLYLLITLSSNHSQQKHGDF